MKYFTPVPGVLCIGSSAKIAAASIIRISVKTAVLHYVLGDQHRLIHTIIRIALIDRKSIYFYKA
jgi:hypothetical protein